MRVNIPFTFDTHGILQWAATSVSRQTLPAMAHKSFAKIANGTDHRHASGKDCVLDETIARLAHALLLAALGTLKL